MMPHFDGVVVGALSIPRAGQNLDTETGRVVDEALHNQLLALAKTLAESLK
jgi:hypothetical protein